MAQRSPPALKNNSKTNVNMAGFDFRTQSQIVDATTAAVSTGPIRVSRTGIASYAFHTCTLFVAAAAILSSATNASRSAVCESSRLVLLRRRFQSATATRRSGRSPRTSGRDRRYLRAASRLPPSNARAAARSASFMSSPRGEEAGAFVGNCFSWGQSRDAPCGPTT